MEKFYLDCGLIVYKTTTEEIQSIGGLGICDACGTFTPDGGYLIPVLNWWMCEECFNDYKQRATRYPEDDPIEKRRALYYESVLPFTEIEDTKPKSQKDRFIDLLRYETCIRLCEDDEEGGRNLSLEEATELADYLIDNGATLSEDKP